MDAFPANAPGYSSAEYLVAAGATAFVFFGCVLAHELSHAVVARREGIGVDGITLWFLGGVTRMTSDATTPKAELAVAGAGPLTSLVLGVVMVGVGVATRAGGVSPLLVEALTLVGRDQPCRRGVQRAAGRTPRWRSSRARVRVEPPR